MHLYNLPILKVSQRIRNLVSAHQQSPNSPNHQAAILRGNLYYNCWVVSEDSLYLRKVDLATGKKSEKQVRIRKVMIMGVFMRDQWLIIMLNQKDIGYISTQSIFENSKLTSITLEKQKFACLYSFQDIISFNLNCFKVLCILDEVIAVYLSENSIVFNKIAQNSPKTLKISAFDVGQSRSDQILNFQLNQQPLFNQNCQKQLVLVLLKITDKNGAKIYILVELLWKKFKYTFHQICTGTQEQQKVEQAMRITTLSDLLMIIYAGKCLLICKRWEEGVHIYSIMPIDTTVKDMIGVEQDSKGQRSIVMLCQKSNKKLIYSYNFRQLLNQMLFQPKIIHYDGNLDDQLIGFIKLPSQYPLLALANQTYILMPTILKLYSIISNVYESEQEEQELQDELFEQTNFGKKLQFLAFSKFRFLRNMQKLQQQAMGQLFSSSKMNTKVLNFQNKLGNSILCLKDDSSICLNALSREYTYIFIYLLNFLSYIKQESTAYKPKIMINEALLLQECKTVFKNIYNQSPLVQEGKLVTLIHKKIINIKDNLLGVLNLLTKSHPNQPRCSQTSKYYYIQILNQTSLHEICNFFTDQTSLIDYLAFFIYKAAIQDNQRLWKIGRQLLSKLLEIRQDYPPLIGLLCGNSMNYAISYHHLHTCKLLSEKQKAESRQLQNLPSLKKTSVSAPSYLKKVGFSYLVSFVPEQYQAQKYDGNFIVLNIPKKYWDFTQSLLEKETIQIRQKVYLMLTQQNIVKSMECMQNSIKVDFLAHSSRQIFIMSQRLKMINEIFVYELVKCLNEKKKNRQNQQKQKQMNYDFKCLSNLQYQKCIKAKDFKYQPQKIQKCEIDEHKQSKIIQTFYSSLLQICQNANLNKLSQFLKTNIMKQQQTTVATGHMQSLQISKILPQQKHQRNQKSDRKFYEVLFKNLWDLYQRIVHFSEVQTIEFEEQLHHSGFSQSFIQTLQQVSCAVELHSTHDIQKLIRSNQVQKFSLQGIIKAVLSKKKFLVSLKPIASLTHFQKSTLFNIARTELIKQCYLLTQQWIYRLEDLLMECALNQACLSFKSQAILAALIELNKF